MGNTVEGWDYEKFQDFVVRYAVNQGIVGRRALAEAADIKVGMLSKYYNGIERPSVETLQKIWRVIKCDWNDLLVVGGRAPASLTTSTKLPELTLTARAQEINDMLVDGSPLSAADRELLDTLLDRVIEPYRRTMRTRRKSA